ncbi:hypothetical protein BH24CHL4_BH24CHL4_08940 [soil metagenome]
MRVRNLAGRLNARSAEELARIAGFWQIPVRGSDRHSVVGQLYREMRDIRTARDLWERLTAGEQDMVRMLALADPAAELSMTLAELASAIECGPQETRSIAAGLYRQGIVAREGDDDELPIGELPRIFLPRELAAVFRRVQDEIDAGDLSSTPLPALLALLDDAEIDHAAELWGVEVVPGLRARNDVIDQILTSIDNENQRAIVIRRLDPGSRNLWNWLLEQPPGAPVELPRAYEALVLAGGPAAAAQRRRTVIAGLEESLLAAHTYRQDASRWLFVPAEIRQPRQRPRKAVDPPRGIDQQQVAGSAWQHPFAAPWDLITMVRALQLPGAPRIKSFEDAPSEWHARLNAALWNSAPRSDQPPPGYLAFLAALARNEGAIDGGGPGSSEPMTLGKAWKHWRSRSFVDQLGRLFWWWNSSAQWIEGQDRGEVFVDHAEWPQFRRKLLVLLATLDPGSWYRMSETTRWIASLDPDILGPGAVVATAGALTSDRDGAEAPAEATAEVIAEELRSAFVWLGLVEFGSIEDSAEVVRPTDMLRQLEASAAPIDVAPLPGEPLVVSDGLSIELRAPTPVRVWSLSAFAETVELRPAPLYQITSASLERALAAGSSVQDVTRFLESQSGKVLPPTAQETLSAWTGAYRRVWLHAVLLIEPDDVRSRERIAQLVREAGWDVEIVEGAVQVGVRDSAGMQEMLDRIAGLLNSEGYTAQEKRPPSLQTVDDRSDGG